MLQVKTKCKFKVYTHNIAVSNRILKYALL